MVQREVLSAMAIGWFLSAWLPVPGVIRHTATSMVEVMTNGIKSVAGAVQAAPPKAQEQQQQH